MATIAARPITTYSKNDGQIYDNTFYDTATLATAQTVYPMFSVQQSATTGTQTTNMTDPGQMSTGVQHQVQGIGIRVYQNSANPVPILGLTAQTLYNQLGKAVLSFDIIGKGNYGEWPVQDFLGLNNIDVQDAANTSNVASISSAMPQFKKLRYPINLASRVRFGVTLTFYGLTALDSSLVGMSVKVLLKGVTQRRK